MAPVTQSSSVSSKRTSVRKPVPRGPTAEETPKEYFDKCRTKILMGHTKTVRTVAWNCDGRRLASGSVDKTVRLWEADQEDIKYSVKLLGHEESVDQLCWSPLSPNELATASTDRTVRFWDTRDSKRCTHIVSTDGENINISWSWNGEMIAVGDKDDKISFIDPRKLPPAIVKTYTEMDDYRDEINEISWNHDCSKFFLTTGSGAIKMLEWPSLSQVQVLKGHTANCYCLDFDPKQRYVATGGADATVTLWDIENGVCLRTFRGLEFPVRTISFSFDGVYLASASEDEYIHVSDVEKGGKPVFKIRTQAATNSVAWHPKGYLLAFAGDAEVDKQYIGLHVFGFNDERI